MILFPGTINSYGYEDLDSKISFIKHTAEGDNTNQLSTLQLMEAYDDKKVVKMYKKNAKAFANSTYAACIAIEKEIPRMIPLVEQERFCIFNNVMLLWGICPRCRHSFEVVNADEKIKIKRYCPNCGQHICLETSEELDKMVDGTYDYEEEE